MSGGHFDYIDLQLQNKLDKAFERGNLQEDFPKSAVVIQDLSRATLDILRDLDWHMSGDCEIADEEMIKAIAERLNCVLQNLLVVAKTV